MLCFVQNDIKLDLVMANQTSLSTSVISTFVFNLAVIAFDHLNPQQNRFRNIHFFEIDFFNYTSISLEHFISCRGGAWVRGVKGLSWNIQSIHPKNK